MSDIVYLPFICQYYCRDMWYKYNDHSMKEVIWMLLHPCIQNIARWWSISRFLKKSQLFGCFETMLNPTLHFFDPKSGNPKTGKFPCCRCSCSKYKRNFVFQDQTFSSSVSILNPSAVSCCKETKQIAELFVWMAFFLTEDGCSSNHGIPSTC